MKRSLEVGWQGGTWLVSYESFMEWAAKLSRPQLKHLADSLAVLKKRKKKTLLEFTDVGIEPESVRNAIQLQISILVRGTSVSLSPSLMQKIFPKQKKEMAKCVIGNTFQSSS